MFELQKDFSYRFTVTFTPLLDDGKAYVIETDPYTTTKFRPMPAEIVKPFIDERKAMYTAMANRQLARLNASSPAE